MKLRSLETILRALQAANVRYLVVGGVAVNAYGYQRLTQDLDLVIGLRPDNVLRALKVLSRLGYRPIVPAGIEEFADAEKREEWIKHKNMQVFSLESDTYRDTTVDVFAKEPFDFEAEYAAAELHQLTAEVQLPLVRLSTLIAMKRHADRPIDQDDVKHLSWILDERDAETLDEP
ncbi:MAG: nucleotidyl transferase AbiEii/AbiGii toxin family protein [Thermoleophilia bacterium]